MTIAFNQHLVTTMVGIGATLVMDVWAIVLKYALNIRPSNYCIVGRWRCYMREGIFRHKRIEAAAPKPYECAVGWITHYLIGILYALVLVLVASPRWLLEPTLLPAMVVGLVTVLMPLFVMQPAFGLGIASSKIPSPVHARTKSLMNHAVFGLGLYMAAHMINTIVAWSGP